MSTLEGFNKGVNLGGWLSQCMHTKEHQEQFIKEEDLRYIKLHKYDHVRVPVDYEVLVTDDGRWKEEGFFYLDRCISWCKKNDLHMIIDLHKTKGYTFDDPESSYAFFRDQSLMEFFFCIWEKLAARYGKEELVAFELLNEIVPYDVAEIWNEIIGIAVARIRAITKETYILIGGVCYNSISTIPLLRFPKSDHLIATFHCYEPFFFTHQGAAWVKIIPKGFRMRYPEEYDKASSFLAGSIQELLKENKVTTFGRSFFEILFEEALRVTKEAGVPLYCGEYGVICNADLESTRKWFHDIEAVFNRHGIGHASWNYKTLLFGLKERRLI